MGEGRNTEDDRHARILGLLKQLEEILSEYDKILEEQQQILRKLVPE